LYSEAHLEEVAKQSQFIQRKSKLSAKMFLDMLLFQDLNNGNTSLNDHSADLQIKYDLQVRKQSLYERFNNKSVSFMRLLLQDQLKEQIGKKADIEALKRFKSVKIKDSTRFQLPSEFKEAYPANGGNASEAGVHIQFEFDLISGKVADLQVTDALKQDNSNARQTADQVEPGSLLLRDLGYFSLDAFMQIHQRKAYYISRLQPNIKLYELKNTAYEVLDLKKIHQRLNRYKLPGMEIDVYLGDKYKVPVRLFIERVPESISEKRLRQAKSAALRKGRILTTKYKEYATLNLFVTNVPAEWLLSKHVRILYKLRWQIELRFKVWKSLYNLHVVKKMNQYRFETYLFAKLLLIIINWEIAVNIISIIWKQHSKMISVYKYYKTATKTSFILRDLIINNADNLSSYLSILYRTSLQNLILEKRKNRSSYYEILLLNVEL
jgi:hypothetical protein